MNLRSLNSSSMQGASFDREIASGFARKAISQDGEAVRSDSSAVAVDDAQVARTTSAPVVLRVGFKAEKRPSVQDRRGSAHHSRGQVAAQAVARRVPPVHQCTAIGYPFAHIKNAPGVL